MAGWQILNISQEAQLFLEHKQCVVHLKKTAEKVSLPISHLSAVILESPFITLSAALLREMAVQNVALFVCDESHLPCGVLLPYMRYFAYSKVAHLQKGWSEPFKGRVWQRIVQAKILNQAYVLRKQGHIPEGEKLIFLARGVTAADVSNIEGQAAALYWKTLFGANFTRDESSFVNSALNYGYAVLRGVVARELVGAGFIPCFGLHHQSYLNAFNLADDLLEPFRPVVDMTVLNLPSSDNTVLLPQHKSSLLEILTKEYIFHKQRHSLLIIAGLVAGSLQQATLEKDYRKIKLFTL